ncbi:MAG: four helix bundle protein [bacterium]|nr:four helix bundle protein [bacterium]
MKVRTYKELIVWQKSMDLVIEIYKLMVLLPREEIYGLASQMKRAVVSIPSNIAERFRRNHKPEQIQFLSIAYASGAELETQLEICQRIGFLKSSEVQKANQFLEEIMRMLNKLSSPVHH